MLQYGIFYSSSHNFNLPKYIFINGKYRSIKLNDSRNAQLVYEFEEICINDCYKIKDIRYILKNVQNIVDVGANQGLFLLVARKHFSNPSIYCYEPNSKLKEVLDHNSKSLNAYPYYEAVTKEDCKVKLNFGQTDLHTTTTNSCDGEVIGTSLEKVIERVGGSIDILKLDCEGAEWSLFESPQNWEKIRAITMEYHLWAKPEMTIEKLQSIILNLGFKVVHHTSLSQTFGILVAIKV